MLQIRVPVAKTELGRRPPLCTVAVDDEGPLENPRPVSAVGAGVHPGAPAGGARNRTRELEAAETGCAGAVQGDGIRCTTPGDEQLFSHVDLREVAAELERETLEAAVGDEQVRAQAERRHGQTTFAGEAECLLQFVDRLRSCKSQRRPSGAQGREA